MQWYKAKKYFDSPLVGGMIPGDVFRFGEDAMEKLGWEKDGKVERIEPETKPAPAPAEKESKPAPKPKKKATKK